MPFQSFFNCRQLHYLQSNSFFNVLFLPETVLSPYVYLSMSIHDQIVAFTAHIDSFHQGIRSRIANHTNALPGGRASSSSSDDEFAQCISVPSILPAPPIRSPFSEGSHATTPRGTRSLLLGVSGSGPRPARREPPSRRHADRDLRSTELDFSDDASASDDEVAINQRRKGRRTASRDSSFSRTRASS
jgi:hypothetical protein